MTTWIAVGIGGGLGAMARHAVNHVIHQRALASTFPTGIFVVNVTGSILIGLMAGAVVSGRWHLGPEARTFLVVGVLGGYTTFSSFSLQTLNLLRNGDVLGAGGNAAISFVACMIAVWIGVVGGQLFNQLRP